MNVSIWRTTLSAVLLVVYMEDSLPGTRASLMILGAQLVYANCQTWGRLSGNRDCWPIVQHEWYSPSTAIYARGLTCPYDADRTAWPDWPNPILGKPTPIGGEIKPVWDTPVRSCCPCVGRSRVTDSNGAEAKQ